MASDVIALLDQLGVGQADLFGYSMGSAVALMVALERPDLVHKIGLASIAINPEGLNPGLMEGMEGLKPEHLIGTPFHDEYLSLAPRRTDFARLVEQVKHMNANVPTISNETFRSIAAPVLIVIGDSDIVSPEHAVELFRLVGGGVIGDAVGLPNSQLAILPGTSHVTLAYRADLLVPIINTFLDAPVKQGS
jgi:pimeloyl-ACP methyl ester carboxylesterase